jgi:hypothetical protein
MVAAGAHHISVNADKVNALNVFPVPDGDTGTNMKMTFASGADELAGKPEAHLGKAAETLSRGLLMGARGNSGVILSQLFRGFAKYVRELPEVDASGFAAALRSGVDSAYEAVVKPVEGTILTVSRIAAERGQKLAAQSGSVAEVMEEVLLGGREALKTTTELLPVLKKVGVVDAGGQGLVYIYEGFLKALRENKADTLGQPVKALEESHSAAHPRPESGIAASAGHAAGDPVQNMFSAEDIEYGYCTEFILRLSQDKPKSAAVYDTNSFRGKLEGLGDSLLLAEADGLVKIHIHAEYPGEVMNEAMKYGDLTRIKIENMREQHANIVHGESFSEAFPQTEKMKPGLKENGLVAVAAGTGLAQVFTSLGVDEVLSGGQTMNPSTEEIVSAIESVPAATVYVLPNNFNIVMAAKQAGEMVKDKETVVIPTATVPQGISAVLAFRGDQPVEQNTAAMTKALSGVSTGAVTKAVRDATIDGIEIRQGDCIGLMDNQLVVSSPLLLEACVGLLQAMLRQGGEVLTVYTGVGAEEEWTERLVEQLRTNYPDMEVEVVFGGQPIYTYLFSVE